MVQACNNVTAGGRSFRHVTGGDQHDWLKRFELEYPMRFFIEPVALAVAFARDVLGYDHVAMMGLSGGGW